MANESSEVRPLPGPCRGLPPFGNLLSLDKTRMQVSFMEKAKVYGNIYQLQLGSRAALILNGYHAIRNALEKQPVVFGSRPDFFTFNLIKEEMSHYGPSMAFGFYGEQWILQRDLADTAFQEFTHGKQVKFLEDIAREEAEELVRHLREVKREGSPSIGRLLRLSVTSTILRYLFGRRSSYDDEMMNELVDVVESKSGKVSGSGNPVDLMPWLRFFKSNKDLRDYRKKFGEVFSKFIEEHYATYEPGSERDVMSHIMSTGRNRGEEELQRQGLDGKDLYATSFDFFPAGTDPVLATLEWIMVYMAKYPQVQADVQSEIDDVVGRDRLPTLDDRDKLPLTQSCLLEIQRYASALPFAVPHCTTQDTVLDGFFVPKDMPVFVNLYSAHYDPEVWKEPEDFNPRRFLTQDGALDEEKVQLLRPFSLGPRRCPGRNVARMKLFSYFATFLHQLKFSCPGGQEVNVEAVPGFPRRPKEFNVQIDPR